MRCVPPGERNGTEATHDVATPTPARFGPRVITKQYGRQEGLDMEPPLTRARHEVIDHDDFLVHEWRVTQLTRLGIPWLLAQTVADHVDWHQVAKLVQRGCPPQLALHIVR